MKINRLSGVAALTTWTLLVSTTANADVNDPKAKELAALMLNMNGLLCASVVEIRPLKVRPEIHEVTCIEYRGGKGTKTYLMNIDTGKAWRP